MSIKIEIDYGPLTELIGVWVGDKGHDVAPDPDGEENNPYFETITFSAVGNVTNAESQVLVALHYHQLVTRKSNNKVFHDETGYWMWDAKQNILMHSLTIPRAVSLIAGGSYTGQTDTDGNKILEVSARINDENWKIIQSPFMQNNAKTKEFNHQITIGKNILSYSETTIVEIYGKDFEHTDKNELLRQ